jgi:hypothetical protein
MLNCGWQVTEIARHFNVTSEQLVLAIRLHTRQERELLSKSSIRIVALSLRPMIPLVPKLPACLAIPLLDTDFRPQTSICAAIRFQPMPLAIPASAATFCDHRMRRRPTVKSRRSKCYKTRKPPQFRAASSPLFE